MMHTGSTKSGLDAYSVLKGPLELVDLTTLNRDLAAPTIEVFLEKTAHDNPFLLFLLPTALFTGLGAVGIYVFDDPAISTFSDSSITIIVNFFIFASVFFMSFFHNRCMEIRDRIMSSSRELIAIANAADSIGAFKDPKHFRKFVANFFNDMKSHDSAKTYLLPSKIRQQWFDFNRIQINPDVDIGARYTFISIMQPINLHMLNVCSGVVMAFPPWSLAFHLGIMTLQMGIIAPLGYAGTTSRHWSILTTHAIVSALLSAMFTYSLRTKSPFMPGRKGQTSIDKLLDIAFNMNS